MFQIIFLGFFGSVILVIVCVSVYYIYSASSTIKVQNLYKSKENEETLNYLAKKIEEAELENVNLSILQQKLEVN